MCVAIPVKLFFEEFSMAHIYIHTYIPCIHTDSNYEARRRERSKTIRPYSGNAEISMYIVNTVNPSQSDYCIPSIPEVYPFVNIT